MKENIIFFKHFSWIIKKNHHICGKARIFTNSCRANTLRQTNKLLFMEDNRKSESEKEIVFSQAIKAGKRIYYIDVKKNRKDEMYLSITESKKNVSGEGDNAVVTFEKHKIFLYREDFAKFANSLNEAINFVIAEQGEYKPMYSEPTEPTNDNTDKLNIDIDF